VKSLALGAVPLFTLDRADPTPLQRQIYDGYRAAILRGQLRPGEQILSSREFAAELSVSRFPVLNAYAQLLAEGYLESRVGAGTFVSTSLPEQQMSVEIPGRAPAVPSGPRPVSRRSSLYPSIPSLAYVRGWGSFGVHQPAFDQFPFAIWSNLVARHSRNPHVRAIHHTDPRGAERFRSAICDYLRTARGVHCSADQVLIVSGSQQALDITARVLLDPGNSVWVEEPGYSLQRAVLTAAGCRLIPVPVDEAGMDVETGIKRSPRARAAFVTPSHQYPLGSTMSASRRIQLLNWAHSAGAWVIEDDYDSEFRYESLPIASMHGLDRNARVIYVGTFSKVLFPSLRLGYMVIPADLVDRLVYKERRSILIDSLAREFPAQSGFEVHGVEAGMHLAMTLPPGLNDREISARAIRSRLWLWPLSPSYTTTPPRHGFILGFGSSLPAQIPRAVRLMRSLVPSA